jgi:phosphonate transport system substrate-binding protein
MKKLIFLILVLYNIIYANQIIDKKIIQYGFHIESILLSNEKEVRIAIQMWIQEFLNSKNLEVKVQFYTDEAVMIDDFLVKKRLDIIGFNPIRYIKNKLKLKSAYNKTMFTFLASKKDYVQYYLIGSNSRIKKSFLDIKDKSVGIKKSDYSAKIWFDYFSIKNFNHQYKGLIKSEKNFNKQSSAIMSLYFKKVDLAVVSKSTWDTMSELNPVIKKEISIIEKSPLIFASYVGVASNTVSKETIDLFQKSVKKVNNTLRGKQILSLLKVNKVVFIDSTYLDNLEEFLIKYDKLKN